VEFVFRADFGGGVFRKTSLRGVFPLLGGVWDWYAFMRGAWRVFFSTPFFGSEIWGWLSAVPFFFSFSAGGGDGLILFFILHGKAPKL